MAHDRKLNVPDNISTIALSAKCPELVENIRQFMRDIWLSNRVFTSHDNIVDHCCEAWKKLVDQPWRIMTHRTPQMSASVVINAAWYKLFYVAISLACMNSRPRPK